MNYIKEIRARCYSKMKEFELCNDIQKVQMCQKLGLFLSDATAFMKLEIDVAYNLLAFLGYSEKEIDQMYPTLISYNKLYVDNAFEKKK